MLRKESVRRGKGRVVEDVRVALEHVANRRPNLGETRFSLFVLFSFEIVDILHTTRQRTVSATCKTPLNVYLLPRRFLLGKSV